jgi:hypothetical protein
MDTDCDRWSFWFHNLQGDQQVPLYHNTIFLLNVSKMDRDVGFLVLTREEWTLYPGSGQNMYVHEHSHPKEEEEMTSSGHGHIFPFSSSLSQTRQHISLFLQRVRGVNEEG